MLLTRHSGQSAISGGLGAADAVFGTAVTAGGTAHVKGSWAQMVASTPYPAYGITLFVTSQHNTASANRRMLMDIGIGASPAVLIANLICGNVGTDNNASLRPQLYHFPIRIPAGSELSARCQSSVTSAVGRVVYWLHQYPIGDPTWYGSRVTTYGANEATSSGTDHTHANGSYATATQIVASAANPIRMLQVGFDLASDTTGNTKRGRLRIGVGSTPDYIAEHLPIHESTTFETVDFTSANFLLALMRFSIPAATRLVVSADMGGTGEARGYVLYGVD
jgi:hypothetical protein